MFPKRTIGKLRRKLNFIAFVLSIFRSNSVEIVIPEREIPGRIEIPCATPRMMESAKLGVNRFPFDFGFNCMNPVPTRKIPIRTFIPLPVIPKTSLKFKINFIKITPMMLDIIVAVIKKLIVDFFSSSASL